MKRRSFMGLLVGWPLAAEAHSFKVGAINIGHAWALPTTQQDAQVFMPLLNTGKEQDSLIAARTDIASFAELRPYNKYDELPMQEFVLHPGKPFPMRPTSKHIRIVGLAKPLVKGDTFKMVLDFLNAGEIEIEVHVQDTPSD
jgi:periplasmic copper chaperone A